MKAESGWVQHMVSVQQVVAVALLREGQEGLPGSGPGFGRSVLSRGDPWAKGLLGTKGS